jgi:hypothetical protein
VSSKLDTLISLLSQQAEAPAKPAKKSPKATAKKGPRVLAVGSGVRAA